MVYGVITPVFLKTAQWWPSLISESSKLFSLRFSDLILAGKMISLLIAFLGAHFPGHARYILLPSQPEITCGAILGSWNCQLLPVCVELQHNYITLRAHPSPCCNVPFVLFYLFYGQISTTGPEHKCRISFVFFLSWYDKMF